MKNKSLIALKIAIFFILLSIFLIGLYLNLNNKNRLVNTIFTQNPTSDEIFNDYVYISGEIKNPGVYPIKDNLRLIELIEQAGGYTSNADINYVNETLNLSEILVDKQKVFIRSLSQSETKDLNIGLINLNLANKTELMELPGIGESTAQKIIDARPFSSINQLLDINGIGDSKFQKIQNLITI